MYHRIWSLYQTSTVGIIIIPFYRWWKWKLQKENTLQAGDSYLSEDKGTKSIGSGLQVHGVLLYPSWTRKLNDFLEPTNPWNRKLILLRALFGLNFEVKLETAKKKKWARQLEMSLKIHPTSVGRIKNYRSSKSTCVQTVGQQAHD